MITIGDDAIPIRSPFELRTAALGHSARLRRQHHRRGLAVVAAALVTAIALVVTGGTTSPIEVGTTTPAEPGVVADSTPDDRTDSRPTAPQSTAPTEGPTGGPATPADVEGVPAAAGTGVDPSPEPAPAQPQTKMLFVRGSGGLWELSLETGALRKLADASWSGRWSPDGHRIVVETGNGLAVVELATGERTVVFEGDDMSHQPVWLPDSATVVFQQNRQTGTTTWSTELWTVDTHTRATRRLRQGSEPSVDRSGRILYRCQDVGWCLTDAAGADLGVAVNSSGFSDAVLSPDGRQLVAHRPGTSSTADLVVQQLDGWGRRVLVSGRSFGRPAWFPDSSRVAFTPKPSHTLEPQGETGIFSVHVDGVDVRRLTAGNGDTAPDLVNAL